MSTPVEEFTVFNISEALQLAKEEADEYRRIASAHGEAPSIVNQRALGPRLTVYGWYLIVLHEDLRIRALKRQVNRLISGETIEGDEEPYPVDECWPPEEGEDRC